METSGAFLRLLRGLVVECPLGVRSTPFVRQDRSFGPIDGKTFVNLRYQRYASVGRTRLGTVPCAHVTVRSLDRGIAYVGRVDKREHTAFSVSVCAIARLHSG